MEKIKKLGTYLVLIGIGMMVGFWIAPEQQVQTTEEHVHAESNQEYTCSMHPSVRQNEPGSCPICGMDLIPVKQKKSKSSGQVSMSKEAMALASIQTTVVGKSTLEKDLQLLGKIKPNEQLIYTQSAHLSGRIEKLYVNYTGEFVKKGQRIASIYSPAFVSAQKELYELNKADNPDPIMLKAARNKLRNWKFTDSQIRRLEKEGEVQTEVDIYSDYTGYVKTLNLSEGDHITQGDGMIEITDLRQVWVLFEAYESDLKWLKKGDALEMEVSAEPGKLIAGKVDFIDPFIDPNTRVAYVRVVLNNKELMYKPDMFVTGYFKASKASKSDELLIPKTAVLWTGKRSVVYVDVSTKDEVVFEYREVVLGAETDDSYVVQDGLNEGDKIAVNGVFKIDAAAQLGGKRSMMND